VRIPLSGLGRVYGAMWYILTEELYVVRVYISHIFFRQRKSLMIFRYSLFAEPTFPLTVLDTSVATIYIRGRIVESSSAIRLSTVYKLLYFLSTLL
jgi:hypothetical protein